MCGGVFFIFRIRLSTQKIDFVKIANLKISLTLEGVRDIAVLELVSETHVHDAPSVAAGVEALAGVVA